MESRLGKKGEVGKAASAIKEAELNGVGCTWELAEATQEERNHSVSLLCHHTGDSRDAHEGGAKPMQGGDGAKTLGLMGWILWGDTGRLRDGNRRMEEKKRKERMETREKRLHFRCVGSGKSARVTCSS